jgi:hypothetical protein
MKITAEPRSDQWNAEDFIGSPRTFTVAGVRAGTAEQKYDILLEGETRVWRPPLTVLRLLMAGWGDDSTVWVGRRVTLFNDESIRFGKEATGGIRVSHMSDLPDGKPLRKSLTETRGKRKTHVIEPLVDTPAPAPVSLDGLDVEALKTLWRTSDQQTRAAIEQRVAELAATETGGAA